MNPYFLKSINLGANIVCREDFEADQITRTTVFWSDGTKEAKKQKVGEWFATLEEAEQARMKMLEFNKLSILVNLEKIGALMAKQDYLKEDW